MGPLGPLLPIGLIYVAFASWFHGVLGFDVFRGDAERYWILSLNQSYVFDEWWPRRYSSTRRPGRLPRS